MRVSLQPTEHLLRKGFPTKYTKHPGDSNRKENLSITVQFNSQKVCLAHWQNLNRNIALTHVLKQSSYCLTKNILEKTENSLACLHFSATPFNLWNTDHPKFTGSTQWEVLHFTEYTKILDLLEVYANKSLKRLQISKSTESIDFALLISHA